MPHGFKNAGLRNRLRFFLESHTFQKLFPFSVTRAELHINPGEFSPCLRLGKARKGTALEQSAKRLVAGEKDWQFRGRKPEMRKHRFRGNTDRLSAALTSIAVAVIFP